MRILNIKVLETSNCNVGTATMTVLTQDGKQLTMHVEVKNSIYSQKADCKVYVVSKGLNGLSRIEIREEDFNNYDSNIKDVIREAKEYIERSYVKTMTKRTANSEIPFKCTLKEYATSFVLQLVVLFLFACVVVVAEYALVIFPFIVLEHTYGSLGFLSNLIAVLWGIVVFFAITYCLIKSEFLGFLGKVLNIRICR